jgi:hypothetical protein
LPMPRTVPAFVPKAQPVFLFRPYGPKPSAAQSGKPAAQAPTATPRPVMAHMTSPCAPGSGASAPGHLGSVRIRGAGVRAHPQAGPKRSPPATSDSRPLSEANPGSPGP